MKILIIGGGNMGLTYADSFLRSHVVNKEDLMILEKSKEKSEYIKSRGYHQVYSSPTSCVEVAELIILAVKPQDCSQLFVAMKAEGLTPNRLILSIMAGVTIDTIQRGLDSNKIVRAMPNLPAQVGAGMTVFTVSKEVGRDEFVLVQNLINTTGKSLYTRSEEMIDAATALSGSGPAYVFNFLRIMTEKGIDMGFSEAEAELLAIQTFKGTVDIFTKYDLSFKQWIDKVASKGGTTEAAMETFDQHRLDQAFNFGMQAAFDRAKLLGNK